MVNVVVSTGCRIRQYEVIRAIGRGGMGEVWLARDTRLGRRVAIKILDEKVGGERMLAEARATARCQHENIVVIHEVDELSGIPYMVLEYLEGATLQERMEETLRAASALEILVPVARALEHAHELGIVHRDLKPENVFVTEGTLTRVTTPQPSGAQLQSIQDTRTFEGWRHSNA